MCKGNRKCWHITTYVALFGIIIGIIMVGCIMGMVLPEYNWYKDYIPTKCNVTRRIEHGQHDCHYCNNYGSKSQKCYDSTYPCVELQVDYWIDGKIKANGTFMEGGVGPPVTKAKCFYVVCRESYDIKANMVNSVVNSKLGQKDISCYYNPNKGMPVVENIIYTKTEIVHAVLWPWLFFIAMIFFQIYSCYTWCKLQIFDLESMPTAK